MRLLFAYGTLCEPKIIQALLGKSPKKFLANLKKYDLFEAGEKQLPDKIKRLLRGQVNFKQFRYLFVKPIKKGDQVSGTAYLISKKQEKILDAWELYPQWYKKKTVIIENKQGKQHKAYIYSLKVTGQRVTRKTRSISDRLTEHIKNAKLVRQRFLKG